MIWQAEHRQAYRCRSQSQRRLRSYKAKNSASHPKWKSEIRPPSPQRLLRQFIHHLMSSHPGRNRNPRHVQRNQRFPQ
ncbi:hypothetical protein AAFF_G00065270 [Aldrovandia affinis]|uniref:Uncharacterized protein n=1 Tax=Aldrovandia affinis TaxID=143900 RepID=A0AAD7T3T4_9TELE|nr:hypothetical protein AAFF_G00065270 [Aldrovandia affinis]